MLEKKKNLIMIVHFFILTIDSFHTILTDEF